MGSDVRPPRVTSIERGRIEVGTLDAPEFRVNPLRYRLLPQFKEWKSSGGALELGELARGEYTLEVAYAGGVEPVLRHSFQVGSGTAWWQSMTFPLLGGASLLVLARRTRIWQRFSYWISKSVFLARRRWRTRTGSELATVADHAGSTFVRALSIAAPDFARGILRGVRGP
jgi:hypothetical protein